MSENTVSHSRVDAYLSCRRKEYYGYGMKLRKVQTSTGLRLGSAGHHLLDVLYSTVLAGGNSVAKQRKVYTEAVELMWDELEKMYEDGFEDADNRATLREVMENYLKREPFIDRSWSDDRRPYLILAVEAEFRLEWDEETGASYPFVVDLLVRAPSGEIQVVDHKFVYDFYSIESMQLMPQIPKYIGALRGLGYKVGSTGIYNMLRTRPNSKGNKWLKAKMVEELLNHYGQDGSPDEMLAWEQDLPKTPVKELEALLDAQGIPFFEGRPVEEWSRQEHLTCSTTRILRTFEEQIEASREVNELDKLDPETRDIRALRLGGGKTCDMCDFKALCAAQLRGDNIEIMIRTEYEAKPKRDDIEVSEDVDS